jgi:hypothetical protein
MFPSRAVGKIRALEEIGALWVHRVTRERVFSLFWQMPLPLMCKSSQSLRFLIVSTKEWSGI